MAAYINGNSYDFANIQIEFLGVRPVGVVEINYSEAPSGEQQFYGLGYKPVAYGYAADVATGTITFQFEEVRNLINAARAAGVPNGNIMKLQPFDITIKYGAVGQTQTIDVLRKCRFISNSVEASQGQTTLTAAYELEIGEIDWSV